MRHQIRLPLCLTLQMKVVYYMDNFGRGRKADNMTYRNRGVESASKIALKEMSNQDLKDAILRFAKEKAQALEEKSVSASNEAPTHEKGESR